MSTSSAAVPITTTTSSTTTTTASCSNCPTTISATADPGSTPGAVGSITQTRGTNSTTGCATLTITCTNTDGGQTVFQLFFNGTNCGTAPSPIPTGSATITLQCNTAGQWTFTGPNGANACSGFGTVVGNNLVLPITAVTCLAA
uniref:C6 domain-containing protein n=1 Tax=Acrobeloides nanus TaxID=290746 RepID=A0A914BVP1_9BILA